MSDPVYAPRWLRRLEAARWVGMSPSKFDQLVKDGQFPKPKVIDGVAIWDRHQLDAAIEVLPDKGSLGDEHDWKVAV